MVKCSVCGKEIEEEDKAILDVPFAGEILNFCSLKCMNGDSKDE